MSDMSFNEDVEIDLDFGGVVAAGTPLDEGEYIFTIEDAQVAPSKDGNSQNLKLKLTVQEPVEFNGRIQNETINIQQSTRPFVKAFLMAVTGLSDEDMQEYKLRPAELVGESVGGFVKHVPNGEKTYANVNSWYTA